MVAAGDAPEEFPESWARLLGRAEQALLYPLALVTDKPAGPPGGDRQDFWTLAPYFWPNPKTADGLPWVSRDGEVNPESESPQYDRKRFFTMADVIQSTALAYRHTRDERFAKCAARWARAWFVTAESRMRPAFTYGHGVPGRVTGSAEGIIRGTNLLKVDEALGWLHGSPHWTDIEGAAWRQWTCEYRHGLLYSELGQKEHRAFNNHGTWYDVQVVTFGLLCEREALARERLEAAKVKRIQRQIKPDGTQPMELLRTKSWDYCVMNLQGMTQLAKLGHNLGVDLWGHRTEAGAGIEPAIRWMLPFATGERNWEGKQIKEFNAASSYGLLAAAAEAYGAEDLNKAVLQMRRDVDEVAMVHFRE